MAVDVTGQLISELGTTTINGSEKIPVEKDSANYGVSIADIKEFAKKGLKTTDLADKPQINGTALSGNKTSDDLGLQKKLDNQVVLATINNTPIKFGDNVDLGGGSGGGGSITIDSELNIESTNAIQNKAVATKLSELEQKILLQKDIKSELIQDTVDFYISFETGEKVSGTSYIIYKPIHVKKDDVIRMKTSYIAAKAAVLSEWDGSHYIPLVKSAGSSNDINYKVPRDMDIVICSYDVYSSGPDGTPKVSVLDLYTNATSTITQIIENERDKSYGLWDEIKQKMFMVAYSSTGFLINTREQFMSAKLLGFDAQKADMEITSDGFIVMCHDQGVTLDESGKSAAKYLPDDPKSRLIKDMTKDEFCAIEHAGDLAWRYGYVPKHTDLDAFLRICKSEGIIPYLTLRKHNTDEVLPILVKMLYKYNLQDRCIISSFPPSFDNILKAKAVLPNAVFVYVTDYRKPLTNTLIDRCKQIGRTLIQIQSDPSVLQQSEEAIVYANTKGVPWGAYDIMSMEENRAYQARGCSMMQVYYPNIKRVARRLNFTVVLTGATAKIGTSNSMYSTFVTYDADVTVDKSENEIHIKNIRYAGTESDIPDAFLPVWTIALPVRLYAYSDNANITSTTVHKNGHDFIIKSSQLPEEATIDVVIDL